MALPWRTLSTRPVLQDRWIDLRADDCATTSGTVIAPYYVLTYPDWVHVVALTPDNLLVLVEQYRHGAGTVCLELPGGAIDAQDATPQAAGQRELREETGYVGAQWRHIASLYANPATQTNRIHTVLASNCTCVGNPELEAGEEGMTIRCLPVAEVLAGLSSGLLSQSMQVAGLMLALNLPPLSPIPHGRGLG